MSVQQCLACNAMVPKSSKTCECGRVFEDVKQIAGKRFSEYRAELYWRLENKRMKALSKENTPFNGVSADQNNNVDNDNKGVNEVVEKPAAARSRPVQAPRKRMFQRKVQGLYPPSKKVPKSSHVIFPCLERASEKTVSPEELRRFSKALEEINKKIHSQNLVWKNLLS